MKRAPAVAPLCIVVPGEPVGTNRLWRKGWHGGIHKSTEAVAYEAKVAQCAALAGVRGQGDLTGSRWELQITYFHQYPKRRKDVDAPVKLVMDSLIGVLYADDYQVVRQSSEVRHDPQNPRVEIVARRVGE